MFATANCPGTEILISIHYLGLDSVGFTDIPSETEFFLPSVDTTKPSSLN